MLRAFIQRVHRRRYFAKPRMIICVPSGCTVVEQRAVKEAGFSSGWTPGAHHRGTNGRSDRSRAPDP
jgi:actin-like ATPase involved in cell morphogenesis